MPNAPLRLPVAFCACNSMGAVDQEAGSPDPFDRESRRTGCWTQRPDGLRPGGSYGPVGSWDLYRKDGPASAPSSPAPTASPPA
jgi:hypothetical protein